MLRSIVAVVAGIVVAALVVFAVEMVGHAAFPTADAPGVDCSDVETYRNKESASACMAATPFGSKFAVVVGWFLGALLGGVVALMIGRKWAPLAWIVAGIIFLLAAIGFVSFPHPIWMMVGAAVAAALGGYGAIRLLRATNAPPPRKP